MKRAQLRRVVTSCAICVAALVAIPTTSAKDGDVLVRGTCTKASAAKLKLSEEDGRIEVEFEVVVVRRPATVLLRATRLTRPPSGSFELRRVVADLAGRDRISARATSPSGEVCRATAAF